MREFPSTSALLGGDSSVIRRAFANTFLTFVAGFCRCCVESYGWESLKKSEEDDAEQQQAVKRRTCAVARKSWAMNSRRSSLPQRSPCPRREVELEGHRLRRRLFDNPRKKTAFKKKKDGLRRTCAPRDAHLCKNQAAASTVSFEVLGAAMKTLEVDRRC